MRDKDYLRLYRSFQLIYICFTAAELLSKLKLLELKDAELQRVEQQQQQQQHYHEQNQHEEHNQQQLQLPQHQSHQRQGVKRSSNVLEEDDESADYSLSQTLTATPEPLLTSTQLSASMFTITHDSDFDELDFELGF